jgi:hypothetical protein
VWRHAAPRQRRRPRSWRRRRRVQEKRLHETAAEHQGASSRRRRLAHRLQTHMPRCVCCRLMRALRAVEHDRAQESQSNAFTFRRDIDVCSQVRHHAPAPCRTCSGHRMHACFSFFVCGFVLMPSLHHARTARRRGGSASHISTRKGAGTRSAWRVVAVRRLFRLFHGTTL